MPRKPMSGARLGELMQDLSVGALLRVIPRPLVDQALATTQRQSKRMRLLPAWVVVYLTISLALCSEVSIQETLRLLLSGLRRKFGLSRVTVAGGTAVSFARRRLGVAPLKWLFEQVAQPVGRADQPGCWWQHLRPVAVDGTTVEVQETTANRARFGQHVNQHAKSGYPQVKVVALLECGTRAPLGLAYDAHHANEGKLADRLLPGVGKQMLVLADRGFYSFARWRDWSLRAGGLLWRVRNDLDLTKVKETFPDGSFLAWIKPSATLCRQGLAKNNERFLVRALRYRPVMKDESRGEVVTLITTLLDPAVVTADELAGAYPLRWTVETGFDDLKTHLRGPGKVLRSQVPDLVEQELYGFFLAYYTVRATMAAAAERAGCPPCELSFTHAVHVIRRHTVFFPSAQ